MKRSYLTLAPRYPAQMDRLEWLRPAGLDWRICRASCAGFVFVLDLLDLGVPYAEV